MDTQYAQGRAGSPGTSAQILDGARSSSSTRNAQMSQNDPTTFSGFGADSSTSDSQSGAFTSNSSQPTYTPNNAYLDLSAAYIDFDQTPEQSPSFQQAGSTSQEMLQPYDMQSQDLDTYGGFDQSNDQLLSSNNFGLDDTSAGNSFTNLGFNDQSMDPSLLDYSSAHSHHSSLDPTNLSYDNMATMQHTHHTPTPPHLYQTDLRPTSASPHQSSSPQQQLQQQLQQRQQEQQQQMYDQSSRSRNVSESLDPSSAAFPQGYTSNEWGSGAAFRSHRRAPSDTFSEISSHSAHASPYMNSFENFDQTAQGVSPMINPQQDAPLFNDTLGLNQFSLSDHTNLQSSHLSPAHSPHVSPLLSAHQQPLPEFSHQDNFGLSPDLSGQFPIGNTDNDYDMFPSMGQEGVPYMDTSTGMIGEADIMSPPEINIDFAPPSRQPSFRGNQAQALGDALSPPTNIGKYLCDTRFNACSYSRQSEESVQSPILLRVHQVRECRHAVEVPLSNQS